MDFDYHIANVSPELRSLGFLRFRFLKVCPLPHGCCSFECFYVARNAWRNETNIIRQLTQTMFLALKQYRSNTCTEHSHYIHNSTHLTHKLWPYYRLSILVQLSFLHDKSFFLPFDVPQGTLSGDKLFGDESGALRCGVKHLRRGVLIGALRESGDKAVILDEEARRCIL